MKDKMGSTRKFVRGAASRSNHVYFISKVCDLLDQEITHTSIIGLEALKWVSCVTTDWDASAIAIAWKPTPKIVVIGEDGHVVTRSGNKTKNESLPKGSGKVIRNAKTIDGYVYACGMKRHVFKRIDENKWTDISAAAPQSPEQAVGFEALDGYSNNEIYAVGWAGEIWHFDGSTWNQEEIATDMILTSVCCAPDGFVYVAGQKGAFLRGRKNNWEIIRGKSPYSEDFWDLCWYEGQLYVATMGGLYILKGDELNLVEFGSIGPLSCFSLTTAEKVLWSIGHKDIASYDGKKWQKHDY